MISIEEIGKVTSNSLLDIWNKFIGFLPSLLGALLVVVLGIVVALIFARIVRKALAFIGIDKMGREAGIHDFLKKRGVDFSFSGAIAWLVKWLVLLAFFVAAINILGISQLSAFVSSIIAFIPNVIVAMAILALGIIAARYVSEGVEESARLSTATRSYSSQLGKVSLAAIIIFSVVAALTQLGIAASILNILFAGIVGMLALAGGLAFGLGGRKNAARILDRVERNTGVELEANIATEEEVRECLVGKEFPAAKVDVINYCHDLKAKDSLENLDDREYISVVDVIRGLRNSRGALG